MVINMKNKYVSQLKSMIEEISTLESQKYGISIDATGYTIIEYINNDVLKQKLSLKKTISYYLKGAFEFRSKYGYYNPGEDKIAILLDNKIYKGNKIIYAIFHECRHCYQFKTNNYINFLAVIEQLIIFNDKELYNKYHDTFFGEIDANIYCYKMAIEYLKKYGLLSKKQEKKYNLLLELHNIYSELYNPILTFHIFCSIIKKESSSELYKEMYFNNSLIRELFDQSGDLLFPNEILKSEFLSSLDEISQNIIIASPYFLNEIDIYDLNDFEKERIVKAIEYATKIIEKNDSQKYDKLIRFLKFKNLINILENIIYQKRNNLSYNKILKYNFEIIIKKINQITQEKNTKS